MLLILHSCAPLTTALCRWFRNKQLRKCAASSVRSIHIFSPEAYTWHSAADCWQRNQRTACSDEITLDHTRRHADAARYCTSKCSPYCTEGLPRLCDADKKRYTLYVVSYITSHVDTPAGSSPRAFRLPYAPHSRGLPVAGQCDHYGTGCGLLTAAAPPNKPTRNYSSR